MFPLSRFSQFQEGGHVPACEIDGKIKYAPPLECENVISKLIPFVSELPGISFTDSSINNKYTFVSSKELFLHIEESKWSRIKTAWFENGLLSAIFVSLETISQKLNFLNNITQNISRSVTKYINKISINGNEDDVLSAFCLCKNWKNGLFRFIKWHPHCNKFAVVSVRDDVHIYSTSSSVNCVLKHRFQRYITCVAWKPLSASELAVGCSEGVFIWNIESNSHVTRPSISCATLLSKPGHKYIISVAWNHQGNLLVSAALCDRVMYVWDVSMEDAVPLHKYGGGIPSLIAWSPISEHFFVATTSTLFRLWSSVTWTSENWYTGSSRIKCACWSPDSSVLLFATDTEPIIYAITVSSAFNVFANPKSNNVIAVCVADLTKQELSTGEILGGTIISMSWDPNGKFLAVIFKDSNFIPIFSTTVCEKPKVLQITPRCLIRGRLNEIPNCVDFQTNLKCGANLTIVWSSGRIQYFPFYSSGILV